MDNTNILNKKGFLTDEDKKQPIDHSGHFFSFISCVDLSQGVKVIPHGNGFIEEFTTDQYSRDLASFITWWTQHVMKDLNGFSGFCNIKFDFVNFKLV